MSGWLWPPGAGFKEECYCAFHPGVMLGVGPALTPFLGDSYKQDLWNFIVMAMEKALRQKKASREHTVQLSAPRTVLLVPKNPQQM